MGMYTGVRAKLVLKDEWVPIIHQVNEGEDWDKIELVSSGELSKQYALKRQLELCKQWGQIRRSSFIPCGALCYMDWKDDDPEWERRIDGNVWIFQCSLKNYDQEIETFFEMYLPHMIQFVIHLEYRYEEWEQSQYWELVDGKLQIVEDTGTTCPL